ncbi:Stf0 family sulfotransferase [Thalassolituus sp. LLYu03]|uniref:Stf0 family sulfotransferase n=1 Tax=Thalassolituus sp. LLYu03 TaxID=3421656 RepID=UPI003D2CAB3B
MKNYVLCVVDGKSTDHFVKDLASVGFLGRPRLYLSRANLLGSGAAKETRISGDDVDAALSAAASAGSGIVALRVNLDQVARVGTLLKNAKDELSSLKPLEAFTQFFSDYEYIFIRQKTPALHMTSNYFGAHGIKSPDDLAEKYNFEDSQIEFQRISSEYQGWRKFFDRFDIKPITLVYEECVESPDYVYELLRRLGADSISDVSNDREGLKRLTGPLKRDFLVKFKADQAEKLAMD